MGRQKIISLAFLTVCGFTPDARINEDVFGEILFQGHANSFICNLFMPIYYKIICWWTFLLSNCQDCIKIHLLHTYCRSWWLWLPVHWSSTMERVTGGGALQLALAGAGVFLLYRILVRLRPGASLQDSVVVITGASSGLGKGQPLFLTFQLMCCINFN